METKEIKLAPESIKADSKPIYISLPEMLKEVEGNGKKGKFFYLSKDNNEKTLKKLDAFFNSKKRSVIRRSLHYSMDNKDFIYEVHVM